jgi:hypothetical protein
MTSSIADWDFAERLRTTARRPTSVTVIAVLSAIFGCVGVMQALYAREVSARYAEEVKASSLARPTSRPLPAPELGDTSDLASKEPQLRPLAAPERGDTSEERQLTLLDFLVEREKPQPRAVSLALQALSWILSGALIVSGIGMLWMQRWARRIALLYGVGSFVYQSANLYYIVTVFTPAMTAYQEYFARLHPTMTLNGPFWRNAAWIVTAFLSLGFVYPIVVLWILTRPKIAAAFNWQPLLSASRLDQPR